ncbi:MAG: hypothetical protein IKO19_05675 [Candidatus Riflebacteria bacterium]|nr:hypothetical protein [Candidatus Riflebacteria bacterium]
MPYSVINAIVVFLAIAAIAAILSRSTKQEKLNLENTKQYCEKNKFEFVRNMKQEEFPEKVKDFTIFQRHIGYKDFHSIVKGSSNGYNFTLLTFIYPGNHRTCGSLVCLVNKKDAKLPKFYLRDSKTISLDKLFGKQEIKLSENKDFSEKFLLQGNDIDETKAFFTEPRMQAFIKEHVKGYEYESDSDYFAIAYPLTPSIPIEEYEALLSKTTTLLTDLGV